MSQDKVTALFWSSAGASFVFSICAALNLDGEALAFATVFGACSLCLLMLEE